MFLCVFSLFLGFIWCILITSLSRPWVLLVFFPLPCFPLSLSCLSLALCCCLWACHRCTLSPGSQLPLITDTCSSSSSSAVVYRSQFSSHSWSDCSVSYVSGISSESSCLLCKSPAVSFLWLTSPLLSSRTALCYLPAHYNSDTPELCLPATILPAPITSVTTCYLLQR